MPGTESFDRVLRTLTGIPKQIAYATSRALNDTARDVQQFTVSRLLPEKFTLRSAWYRPGTRFGFNINFSSKTNLVARIGSRANWLKLQEEGGAKSAVGHRLAIPTEKYKPKPALMLRRMKPRAILAAQAASILHERAGARMEAASRALSDIEGRAAAAFNALPASQRRRGSATASGERIGAGFRSERKAAERVLRGARSEFRRAGTRAQNARRMLGAVLSQTPFIYGGGRMPAGIYIRTSKARLPLMKLFTFEPSVRISPILHFVGSGKDVVNRVYLQHFNKRLVEAFIGAK